MFSTKKTAAKDFILHKGVQLPEELAIPKTKILVPHPVFVPFENPESFSSHYPVGATLEAGKIECLHKKYIESPITLVVKNNAVLGILTPRNTHLSRVQNGTKIVSYQRENSETWISLRREKKLTDIPELITSENDVFIDKRGKRKRDSVPMSVQLVAGKKYIDEDHTTPIDTIFAVDLTKDKKAEVIGEIINKTAFHIPYHRYAKCTTVTPLTSVMNIGRPKKNEPLLGEQEFLFFSNKELSSTRTSIAKVAKKENHSLLPRKKNK